MENVAATEEWRAIEEAPGYEVSNWGRVRSYKRRQDSPKELRTYMAKGRELVQLRMPNQFWRQKRRVHRLVLEAFRGRCPEKCEGCHNDGNPANNRLENLRWDTHRNNLADCVRHNTRLKGDRHPNKKLKAEDREFLRELLRRGFSMRRIAVLYGVHVNTVAKAKMGE